MERIYSNNHFVQPAADEPIRSVVTESPHAVVVMWHVLPGQQIRPHVHPAGQDTWVILSGQADYIVDGEGTVSPVTFGQTVVARAGQIHGAINRGLVPFEFISVVAPFEAGYELVG